MILFKLLTKNKLTLFESLLKMFTNLTMQSNIKDIRHYCQPGKKYRSIILIIMEIIWLFSALIISNSFTGLLLSTFFNVKSTPVVTTLQDIRDNPHIIPIGHHHSLLRLSSYHKFNLDDILIRMKENTKILTIQNLFQLIVNGQAVGLYNSIQMNMFIEIASRYIDRIIVSDSKYLPNYTIFSVKINYEFTKIVEF